jgi:hypothetical protein
MNCANQPIDSAHVRLAIGRLPSVGTCDGVGPFLPAACSHFLGPGANRSPHTGHSIRSKSMRFTLAGVITCAHFGHTLSSDASTLTRLIFFRLGTVRAF